MPTKEKTTKAAAKKTESTKAKKEDLTRTGRVFGGNLNIRKEPDVNAGIAGVLDDGTEVTILEDLGEWLKIEAGYVMKKWVK